MLTALEHQKIAALAQVANLVSQAASVAHELSVLQTVANNCLSLISQWERNDPDFSELAILLRRAKVSPSPDVMNSIIGLVNRIVNKVQIEIPSKRNYQGDIQKWDPIRGVVTSPIYENSEPVRSFSPGGDWRGSKKYPFGKPIPTWNEMGGVEKANFKILLVILVLGLWQSLT